MHQFLENVQHNLFKPLLLFFYMGFLVPILGVNLDFPHVIYQGLTIFLLIAIGWHGGEELAKLSMSELTRAGGFMTVGFFTNFVIGILAYLFLRSFTRLRRIDAATVAGYYGSDSAGTFAIATGVMMSMNIKFAAYMPVMLAVMEIPGCLVALFLVATLRRKGMDGLGNMPDEVGYDPAVPSLERVNGNGHGHGGHSHASSGETRAEAMAAESAVALEDEQEAAFASDSYSGKHRLITPELLHEVFLNPGIYLLMAGIAIGFISGKQGPKVTEPDDMLFNNLFQGLLCLFLLEMGMTASSKLRDLRTAGLPFILYGLTAPTIFATVGMLVAHGYSMVLHQPFDIGTYVLFSVLCGAASYIAVPAVQRLAIPEASPTLPLAASLGLTFSWNVTLGITLYVEIAKLIVRTLPVGVS